MRSRLLIVSMALVAAATVAPAVPVPAAPAYFQLATAVGSPFEDVGRVDEAGAVHLIGQGDSATFDPANSITITRATLGGTPVAGDRFGTAVELALVDDDNRADLIIGAPGADRGAGRVYVVFFLAMEGRFDVAHPVVLRQGNGGVPGTSEPGDRFGAALHDTYAGTADRYLAIGAPGEDVREVRDAGAITVIRKGTDITDDAVYYQGSGLPGTAEEGDAFGSTLAQFRTGLAVGAPREDVGSIVDAGNVTALYRGAPGSGMEFHEGAGDVPGVAEAGDRFGAALQGRAQNALAVGVPGEDIGGVVDAGAVVDLAVPGGVSVTTTYWYQGGNGLAGVAEEGDRFGSALTALPYGVLAVGSPGEDAGGLEDVGMVQVIGLVIGHTTLSAEADQQFRQDTRGVPGTAESGDQMGDALGTIVSTLVVGVSREDVHGAKDAGAIITFGLDDEQEILVDGRTRQITQDDLARSTAEPVDRFGAELV